jgi:hypothetical protein
MFHLYSNQAPDTAVQQDKLPKLPIRGKTTQFRQRKDHSPGKGEQNEPETAQVNRKECLDSFDRP